MTQAEPNLADFAFEESVAHSLSLRPRRIASKWLYDDVGAGLFEGIVASPGYYAARAELEILEAHGPEVARALGRGGSLVELGSGASVKVRRLLDAMPDLARYVPVEISEAQLAESAAAIRADYPDLEVTPIAADFTRDFALADIVGDGPVLGFFPGSTLCNLLPENSEAFLRRMHALLGPDSLFLVGVDLQKDEAIYNTEAKRIEAAIYPLRDLAVTVAGRRFDLPAEQPIVLEYSHKYTLESFAALAARAGWETVTAWTDREALFSVHLLTNRSPA